MNNKSLFEFVFDNGECIVASGFTQEEARADAELRWFQRQGEKINRVQEMLDKLDMEECRVNHVNIIL